MGKGAKEDAEAGAVLEDEDALDEFEDDADDDADAEPEMSADAEVEELEDFEDEEIAEIESQLTAKQQGDRSLELRREIERRLEQKALDHDLDDLDYLDE